MKTRFRAFCALVVVALLAPLIAWTVPAEAGLADMPYRLAPGMTSSTGANISSLDASDSLIVWEDHRDGSPDVLAYDLEDRREFRIDNTDRARSEPSVSGSTIVWTDGAEPEDRTIRGVDLTAGSAFDVTDEPGEVAGPVVSDALIAWQEKRDNRWFIEVRDRSLESAMTLGETGQNSARPDVSSTTLVWQEHDGVSWNIHLYDAESGESRQLTANGDDDQYPAISGDRIVFTRTVSGGGAPHLIVMDLQGDNEQVVTSEHFVQRPAIHGNLVVWEDWRSGLPDIYAWDLAENDTFAVARSQQANDPVVSGSSIAWVSGSDLSRQRIQTLEIQDRLPTDPKDPPAVPSPDRLYTPETKQFVSSGFKSFWQANGGPQVLGYPLTEEFTEEDPETGETQTVQYFERVKLEFHGEAEEGQRIRLSLLGYELHPPGESEPVEPFENSEMQRYFPETGQAISYGFKEFWEANGGLAVFGFPITGEFTENGRTVQYFERARFELDPESDDGEVQLGLLGREALQDRGWLPPPPVDTTQIFE